MKPETRAFLDAVRDAEDPTPEEQRRVLDAVQSSVADGSAAGIGGESLPLSGSFGLKLGALAVSLGAAAAVAALGIGPASPQSARELGPEPPIPAPQLNLDSGSPEPSEHRAPGPELPPSAPVPATRRPSPAQGGFPSLRLELAILSRVQAALQRGDGLAALEELDGHRTSDRQFLAERRAARILALCAVGRITEARRAATEFVHQHPTSVQQAAVARSCAGTETEKP